MAEPVTIDLRHVARGLGLPLAQVQAVVELLDEGNTVPFITRYRKDRTGGLDDEQIRQIQARLAKQRLLAERKQTILRSIEAQGKLTEELAAKIQSASATKRVEDLYLPYKPKKQTLAMAARARGLEPLALEILDARPSVADLDRRAADFVNPDKKVPSAADALLGAGHILAELFNERADLRQRLRDILERSGRLASTRIGAEPKAVAEKAARPAKGERQATGPAARTQVTLIGAGGTASPIESSVTLIGAEGRMDYEETIILGSIAEDAEGVFVETVPPAELTVESAGAAMPQGLGDFQEPAGHEPPGEENPGSGQGGGEELEEGEDAEDGGVGRPAPSASVEPAPSASAEAGPSEAPSSNGPAMENGDSPALATSGDPGAAAVAEAPAEAGPSDAAAPQAAAPAAPRAAAPAPAPTAPRPSQKAKQRKARKKKQDQEKKRAEEKKQKAFAEYFDYSEEIRKIQPHRMLTINRGERAKVLRVKIEYDLEAMYQAVDELCVPEGHPHADLLRGCARDALVRLILPSLERDARRELTERAEQHAVTVFGRNLRSLLLQPPVRGKRVLALDPGYKNGCKLVALDQFGNVLAHDTMYLIGKPERREKAKQTIAQLAERFQIDVIAIGNGMGSRDAEDFVAGLLGSELKDKGLAYVIVNEAGADIYATSRAGREEFPEYDASVRSAISIGRRLQDPLAELVKIPPAEIGVGLYQHDVKAKHLEPLLDEVMESCVNHVGVDVNSAGPALLRYVSGLNPLTAKRLYDYRQQNGPFRSRDQLRQVPGFGEATFVQAAGFLKVARGDNPLDATRIHPQDYETAGRVIAKLGIDPSSLARHDASLAERVAKVNAEALAKDLGIAPAVADDILSELARPGRDPRGELPAPVFKRGGVKLEDLVPGMELMGTVLNVVDFGAFIDIGIHDSGLVHVSQMADKFVRDPHDVISVGDVVKVWVVGVDKERRRVSLTMIAPGNQRGGAARPTKDKQEGHAGGGRAERPRFEKRPQGRGAPRGKGEDRPKFVPKPRPKPVVPITEEMKTGKTPMRSFSDLAQFFQVGQQAPKAETKPSGQTKPKPAQPPKPQEPIPDASAGEPRAEEPGPADSASP